MDFSNIQKNSDLIFLNERGVKQVHPLLNSFILKPLDAMRVASLKHSVSRHVVVVPLFYVSDFCYYCYYFLVTILLALLQ